jgi:hypothetical protein
MVRALDVVVTMALAHRLSPGWQFMVEISPHAGTLVLLVLDLGVTPVAIHSFNRWQFSVGISPQPDRMVLGLDLGLGAMGVRLFRT